MAHKKAASRTSVTFVATLGADQRTWPSQELHATPAGSQVVLFSVVSAVVFIVAACGRWSTQNGRPKTVPSVNQVSSYDYPKPVLTNLCPRNGHVLSMDNMCCFMREKK